MLIIFKNKYDKTDLFNKVKKIPKIKLWLWNMEKRNASTLWFLLNSDQWKLSLLFFMRPTLNEVNNKWKKKKTVQIIFAKFTCSLLIYMLAKSARSLNSNELKSTSNLIIFVSSERHKKNN